MKIAACVGGPTDVYVRMIKMKDAKASKGKKKTIPRLPMPEQEPDVRRRNFDEVPLGYTP